MVQNPEDTVRRIRRITGAGMVLNVVLTLCKGAGGVLFHSQALLADAVHSFSDLATDLAVIFGVRFWAAPPDASHPYGHGKIETLISFLIGAALAAVAAGLIGDAAEKLLCGKGSVPELPAFFIALLSIVSKELLYRWTKHEAELLHSPAMAANAWHHRSDALSSLPVALAVTLGHFFPSVRFFDSAGAVLVSFFIFSAAWTILKPALYELTDAGAGQMEKEIRRMAETMPEIRAVHAIRTRRLGSSFCADLHVMVEPELTVRAGHAIAHALKRKLIGSELGIRDVVIHVEPCEGSGPDTRKRG